MFDEGKEAVLVKTEGTWDMINLLMVVHAWNYDGQVRGSQGPSSYIRRSREGWMLLYEAQPISR